MTRDIENRASGRTIGLMLQTLGLAVKNPGLEVEFVDHHLHTISSARIHAHRLVSITRSLGLNVTVKNVEEKVFLISKYQSPYSLKRTPAEEKWKDIYGNYPIETNAAWGYFKKGFTISETEEDKGIEKLRQVIQSAMNAKKKTLHDIFTKSHYLHPHMVDELIDAVDFWLPKSDVVMVDELKENLR